MDASSLHDPLVRRVDGVRQFFIGEDPAGQIAAAAKHDGTQHAHETDPSTRRGGGASGRFSLSVWPILSSTACRTMAQPMPIALAKPSGLVCAWLLMALALRRRKEPALALPGSILSASARNALRARRYPSLVQMVLVSALLRYWLS